MPQGGQEKTLRELGQRAVEGETSPRVAMESKRDGHVLPGKGRNENTHSSMHTMIAACPDGH